MKRILLCWTAALFYSHAYPQQSTSKLTEAEKVRILAYLINGRSSGSIANPVGNQKGACFIQIICKKGFFSPFADTINRIAESCTKIIAHYALGSRLKNYDSIYYLIYSYNDSATLKRQLTCPLKDNVSPPQLTQQERLASVLGVLPFVSGGVCDGHSTSLELRAIKGYSPCEDLATYAEALSVVVDDYVCHAKIHIEIMDELGKTYSFSLNPMDPNGNIIQFSN